MIMKAALLLALAFAPWLACAQPATVIDFRGAPMGASEAEWKEKTGITFCHDARSTKAVDRLCVTGSRGDYDTNPANQFGGVAAKSITAMFFEGRLSTVIVALTRGYERVQAALVEKFGPPHSLVEEPYQTKGGLKATNVISTWRIGDSEIQARSLGSSINESLVTYDHVAIRDKAIQRMIDSAKDDAKKL